MNDLKMAKEIKSKFLDEIYSELDNMEVMGLEWGDVNGETTQIFYLKKDSVLKYLKRLQRKLK